MLDSALVQMLRDAVAEIEAWIRAEGPQGVSAFTLDDVNWDHPTASADPLHEYSHPREALEAEDLRRKASHSIGFVCGVAAGLDVTPLELLWQIGVDTERLNVPAAKPAKTTKRRAPRARKGT